MVDRAPTDAKAETRTAPFPDRPSGTTFYDVCVHGLFGTRSDVPGQLGRPPEERDAGNIVEAKIRLPETLRQRLAAEGSRNKRTLTAEIRARLELSCAIELFTRALGRGMAAIDARATDSTRLSV